METLKPFLKQCSHIKLYDKGIERETVFLRGTVVQMVDMKGKNILCLSFRIFYADFKWTVEQKILTHLKQLIV